MTEEEVKEFQKHVGGNKIQLFGYTSTSICQVQAMSFAWENKTTGHSKVLFQINWNDEFKHYYLNAGAYDYEEEIVLYDSVELYVIEVRQIFNEKDEKLHTLIVLGSRDKDGGWGGNYW